MQERGRGVKGGRVSTVCVAMMVCVLWACEARQEASAPGETPSRTSENTVEAQAARPLRPTPKSDRIVAASAEIPARPMKIVSLAPNVTELLFSVGVEPDRVVGITRFCDRPKEQVANIAKVGGFIDPDMEKMLSLEPDLIVGMKVGDVKLVEKLEKANLRHVFLQMDTLSETLEGVNVLGDVVDEKEGALALHERMAEAIGGPAPEQVTGPSTLFVVGREPLVIAGTGTFATELVARAGGKSATDKEGYVMVDMEYVLKLDPEVIIDTSQPVEGARGEGGVDVTSFWSTYEGLRAVKKGEVHGLDPSWMRPGPGLIEAHGALVKVYADREVARTPAKVAP